MIISDVNVNAIINYSFGIAGFFIYVLLLVLMIVFKKKQVGPNHVFGYRTRFSLSSEENWKWSNDTFIKIMFIGGPIGLTIHIIIFIFAVIYNWPGWVLLLTMFSPVFLILGAAPFIEIFGRKKFRNNK